MVKQEAVVYESYGGIIFYVCVNLSMICLINNNNNKVLLYNIMYYLASYSSKYVD